MLKLGGHIFHWAPTNNFVDHGLYQINPGLLLDYYAENKFNIKESVLLRYDGKLGTDPWQEGFYNPYELIENVNHPNGILGNEVYLYCIVAEKTENSTVDRIPMQGAYKRKMEGEPKEESRSLNRAIDLNKNALAIKTDFAEALSAQKMLIEAQEKQIERMKNYEAELLKQLIKK